MDTLPPADDSLLAFLVQAVRPKFAQAILGIGRSKLYGELGKGKLDAVKDGPRTLITTESIRRYQANRPAAMFKAPKPPRLESLDRLHPMQAQERAKRRAERRQRRSRRGRE
jgi:hypothetical protein